MTTPHLQRDGVTLYAGDCLDVLRELPGASPSNATSNSWPTSNYGFLGNATPSARSNSRARISDSSPS